MNFTSPFESLYAVITAQGEIFSAGARRFGIGFAWIIGIAVFALFAIISFHAIIWTFLLSVVGLGPFASACLVFLIDLLLVALCIVGAFVSRKPLHAEAIARKQRDEKIAELRDSFAWSALLAFGAGPVGKLVLSWIVERIKNRGSKKKIKG